ncbi:MAG: hypothetical protein B7Z72_13165, partial [Gemmatimonadetes bacterium 21-71-4]
MTNPEELLQQFQHDLESADYDETAHGGMDRRHFVFLSLAAAAASTLGAGTALAQPGPALAALGGQRA